MPLFEVDRNQLLPHSPEQFGELNMYERADIQPLLRDDVAVLDPDLLVISEEFGNWQDARRRIDLLAIGKDCRLVVIELKRTDDGGHMDLQAIRYAAMVSTMAFRDVVTALEAHRAKHPGSGPDVAPEEELRNWLEQPDNPDQEPEIPTDVSIILVSADFSMEITTSVIWLNKFEGIDIRCVRLQPYNIDGRILLNIEQVLPLPEAADYQVKVRRKAAANERARTDGRDFTKYSIVRGEDVGPVLNKRRAMLEMIRALHEADVPLQAIQDQMPSARRMLTIAEELRDADEVIESCLRRHPKFEPGRWFVDEAFVQDGQTFLVSKMWGTNTEPALTRLMEAFPETGVSFETVNRD